MAGGILAACHVARILSSLADFGSMAAKRPFFELVVLDAARDGIANAVYRYQKYDCKAFVMRRPSLFTQRGVARVLRAVKQAGVTARVEIARDGAISIIPANEAPVEPVADKVSDPVSDWDEAIDGKRL